MGTKRKRQAVNLNILFSKQHKLLRVTKLHVMIVIYYNNVTLEHYIVSTYINFDHIVPMILTLLEASIQ